MKTFEQYYNLTIENLQYNNIDKKEEFFLQLAHLDELEIVFDFIKYNLYIFYFYKDICLFIQNNKSKHFWINNGKIWSSIESKFGLEQQETKDIMSSMVDKYFKLNGYTTITIRDKDLNVVYKHFFKLNI